MTPSEKFETVDDYILSFPANIQGILRQLRSTILKAAPSSVELISYDMPTFKLNGKRLVYFAAWTTHIGLYSIPSGDEDFRNEISVYASEKGSLRFPVDNPIPYDLVGKLV